MPKDRLIITVGDKCTLRVTHDDRILLTGLLSKTELKATISLLSNSLVGSLNEVRDNLVRAFGNRPPDPDCSCPTCELIKLRDHLCGESKHH
jgi:hypothetical protein